MWDEQKVRIVDIAEELNISTATVSNVIHGKTSHVSKATIKRVQQKLEEAGYFNNIAATLLAQNDSRIIGIVVHDHPKYEGRLFEDPFIASAINYLSDEVEHSGCFMMLKKAGDISEIARFASMWNMVGMVLIGFCADEYDDLRSMIRIPFVVYDGDFTNKGRICNLIVDDVGGGRLMGEHLKSLGHSRVLCIADNDICMDDRRYQGLCEGLCSTAVRMLIPMEAAARLAYYESNLDKLLSYTAIFAVSDFYAVELMHFLQSHGIEVPRDISIAGFDGTPVCRQVHPTLTTVAQDNACRAGLAMESIAKMRNDTAYKDDIIIPVRLIQGESTAEVF